MTTEANDLIFVHYIGLQFVKEEDDRLLVVLDVEPHHKNRDGLVHGSVYHAMLDSVMGSLAYRAHGRRPVPTVELTVRYLKGVREGRLVAESRVLKAGKRVLVLDGEVRQGEDVVAVAQGTFLGLDK